MSREKMMLQSVQTALLVFETIAKSEPVGVTEIARRLNLSKSTAQRCLKALERSGWIKIDETASSTRWMITAKAFGLGQRVSAHGPLREAALPVMSALWEKIGESVHLVVAEGGKAILLDQCETPVPFHLEKPRIAWAPLHTAQSGKVMLAYADPRFVDQYIAGGLDAFTRKTVTDPQKLRKELDKIRKQGWAMAVDEMIEGGSGAAAPIFGWDGRNVAALAVTLPTTRFTESMRKKIIPLLVAAAADISRKLKEG
jgi:DNA-binding IclR family transcriptional regulator